MMKNEKRRETIKNVIEDMITDYNLQDTVDMVNNNELLEDLIAIKERVDLVEAVTRLTSSDDIEQIQLLLDTVTPLCGYFAEMEFNEDTYECAESLAEQFLKDKKCNPMQAITYLLIAASYLLNTTEFIFVDENNKEVPNKEQNDKEDSFSELASLLASLTKEEIQNLLKNKTAKKGN